MPCHEIKFAQWVFPIVENSSKGLFVGRELEETVRHRYTSGSTQQAQNVEVMPSARTLHSLQLSGLEVTSSYNTSLSEARNCNLRYASRTSTECPGTILLGECDCWRFESSHRSYDVVKQVDTTRQAENIASLRCDSLLITLPLKQEVRP